VINDDKIIYCEGPNDKRRGLECSECMKCDLFQDKFEEAGHFDMTELELRIKQASQYYYGDADMSSPDYSPDGNITDEEFDSLIEQLRIENPNSEILQQIGWGYDINEDTLSGEKRPHKYVTVGSLTKARNWKELGFDKPIVVDITPKLDGLSGASYYENGKLKMALTRGNGTLGIDITEKIGYMLGDGNFQDNFSTGVRGEIIMRNTCWKAFKERNPEYMTSRNSTAGIVRNKEITHDLKYLDYIPYTYIGSDEDMTHLKDMSWEDYIDWMESSLKNHFADVTPRERVCINESNYEEIFKYLYDRWSEEYPIDGLVLTYGVRFTNKGIEYDSIAFKFPGKKVQSTVKYVEWRLSKTGYIVPRVWYEPVELDGTINQKATGYNAQWIKDNLIGPGAVIEIERCGDVVPNIINIIQPATVIDIISDCPECGHELQWSKIRNVDNNLAEGVHLMCVNSLCGGAAEKDLEIWLDYIAPIEGFGTILKFKYLRNNPKFDGELPTIEELMASETLRYMYIGEHGAQDKLYNMMIDKLKKQPVKLVDAIKALNIPRLGDKTAEKFAEYPKLVKACIGHAELTAGTLEGVVFETWSSLRDKLKSAIGDANSESVLSNFRKFARLRYIYDRIIWEQPNKQGDIKGKVAITGRLSLPRAKFEEELKAAGYIPSDLKKDTNFLITDTPDSSSSKNKKASELGIEKITEQEFRSRFM